jgi:hypothetical protein
MTSIRSVSVQTRWMVHATTPEKGSILHLLLLSVAVPGGFVAGAVTGYCSRYVSVYLRYLGNMTSNHNLSFEPGAG